MLVNHSIPLHHIKAIQLFFKGSTILFSFHLFFFFTALKRRHDKNLSHAKARKNVIRKMW